MGEVLEELVAVKELEELVAVKVIVTSVVETQLEEEPGEVLETWISDDHGFLPVRGFHD